MIYLTIISLLIIAFYTGAVCAKQKGIPYSISATFYKLKHPYWFMSTMWFTAFTLAPSILEISKLSTEWSAFIAVLGLLLVGAAPNFKNKNEEKVHITGAVLCLVFSQIWVILNCPIGLLVWFAWVIYTIIYMGKKWKKDYKTSFIATHPMFWVEIAALVSVYIGVFKGLFDNN